MKTVTETETFFVYADDMARFDALCLTHEVAVLNKEHSCINGDTYRIKVEASAEAVAAIKSADFRDASGWDDCDDNGVSRAEIEAGTADFVAKNCERAAAYFDEIYGRALELRPGDTAYAFDQARMYLAVNVAKNVGDPEMGWDSARIDAVFATDLIIKWHVNGTDDDLDDDAIMDKQWSDLWNKIEDDEIDEALIEYLARHKDKDECEYDCYRRLYRINHEHVDEAIRGIVVDLIVRSASEEQRAWRGLDSWLDLTSLYQPERVLARLDKRGCTCTHDD